MGTTWESSTECESTNVRQVRHHFYCLNCWYIYGTCWIIFWRNTQNIDKSSTPEISPIGPSWTERHQHDWQEGETPKPKARPDKLQSPSQCRPWPILFALSLLLRRSCLESRGDYCSQLSNCLALKGRSISDEIHAHQSFALKKKGSFGDRGGAIKLLMSWSKKWAK